MYMKRAITVITALLMLSACGATSPKPAKVTPTPPQNITIAFGGDTNGVEHISNYLNTVYYFVAKIKNPRLLCGDFFNFSLNRDIS